MLFTEVMLLNYKTSRTAKFNLELLYIQKMALKLHYFDCIPLLRGHLDSPVYMLSHMMCILELPFSVFCLHFTQAYHLLVLKTAQFML